MIKTAASEWKTERNFMSVKLTISSTLTQQVQAMHSLQALFTACTTKKNFEDSIKFGNITGGKCVTSVGCLSSSCTEQELLEVKENYYK